MNGFRGRFVDGTWHYCFADCVPAIPVHIPSGKKEIMFKPQEPGIQISALASQEGLEFTHDQIVFRGQVIKLWQKATWQTIPNEYVDIDS